jgi:hypothetical protein
VNGRQKKMKSKALVNEIENESYEECKNWSLYLLAPEDEEPILGIRCDGVIFFMGKEIYNNRSFSGYPPFTEFAKFTEFTNSNSDILNIIDHKNVYALRFVIQNADNVKQDIKIGINGKIYQNGELVKQSPLLAQTLWAMYGGELENTYEKLINRGDEFISYEKLINRGNEFIALEYIIIDQNL